MDKKVRCPHCESENVSLSLEKIEKKGFHIFLKRKKI